MIRSPPASALPAGALLSPYPATRPSAKAIQPRSITRSARTILALPITVSDLVEVISVVFLHAAAANDITSPIRPATDGGSHPSWTMATMATPARIFSSIRSTTMARLTASRDAYAHPTPYTRRLKPRDAALFCPDGHLSALCDLSCSCAGHRP